MAIRKFRGRGSSGVSAFSGRAAFNLGGPTYYASIWPYINLIRTAINSAWSPATWTNSNYWLTNLPNGQTVTMIVAYDVADAPNGYVKTGNYVITWSGPLTVQPQSSGYNSNLVVGANRTTFTLSAIGNDQPYIFLQVSNSSGSAASVNDIVIMHADHEALHNAGEIFAPEFLSDIASTNVSTLRTMDWSATNNSDVVNAADFAVEANMLWHRANIGAPPSVIGKLGTKTGKSIWACAPHQATNAAMAYFYAEIAANYPSGTIHSEYSNEAWNFIFEQTLWMLNTGSVGLTIVDSNGNPSSADQSKIACGYANGALRTWAAAEAAFGTGGRVRRVYANQMFFSALGAGTEYTDPGHISVGVKVKTLLAGHEYAVAPYFNIEILGSTPDQTDGLIKPKFYAESDATWNAAAYSGITTAAGLVASSKASIEAKTPTIQMTSYECGHHLSYQMGFTSVEPCTISAGDNTITFAGADISTWFDNGEVLWTYPGNSPTFMAPSLGFNIPVWVRKLGTTKLRLYASEALYNADSGNTGTGAIALTAVDSYTYGIDWYTRIVALGQRVKGLLSDANGLAWYQQYYQEVFVANSMNLMLQFVDAGGWADGRETFAWGMKPHYGATDTPRSAWFKTI